MGILREVIKRKRRLLIKHRKEAIKFAQEVAKILVKEFGAEKVILWGSLARGGSFDFGSDIDLVVEGLRERFFSAYGFCLGLGKFEIDLKDYDDLPGELKAEIEKGGVILYERGKETKGIGRSYRKGVRKYNSTR